MGLPVADAAQGPQKAGRNRRWKHRLAAETAALA